VWSVAVVQAHQPKLSSFGLNFTPTPYRRTCVRRSVQLRALDVLGPVPGVDVMAKGPQGLLDVVTLSRGLLAVSGVTAEVPGSAGGGAFFYYAACLVQQ
jgi:hypothetical protein